MCAKYVIGIDFGTESGRAVLINVADGAEIAAHVTAYRHGVMSETLPDGTKLGFDWALQHPGDYLEVLGKSVPQVLRLSSVHPSDVIGIGVDFTSCTLIPLDLNGSPLCMKAEWAMNPHSWVKLWKHHAAQKEANLINEIADQRGERFRKRYGGKQSPEWTIAKILQMLNEAPEMYDQTDLFMEAADWIVMKMTGQLVRNISTTGFKAIWDKSEGYPSNEFFAALDPRLEKLVETKLRGTVAGLGTRAGNLTAELAEEMGLRPGIAVAVGHIDGHAAVPAMGAVTPGKLVMSMGTSICHLLLSDNKVNVEGICGIVEDGIVPGYYGYEAGQPAVGDLFAWFVNEAVPGYVKSAAQSEELNVHQWLESKAAQYAPGETGLLALDWWNGNRSVLGDADLSGLIVGLTLRTKPEEIYRALLESTAFATRRIIESFEDHGLEVKELYACGGLPQKNRLLMQIYADVTGKEITIADSTQTAALGAGMYAAVAAGIEEHGYATIVDASRKMARVKEEKTKPDLAKVATYEEVYQGYISLHDYFGRDSNSVMKKLKAIKRNYT